MGGVYVMTATFLGENEDTIFSGGLEKGGVKTVLQATSRAMWKQV